MKRQVGLVRASVLSMLLGSAALVFTGPLAQAADMSMPVKAVAKPVPYWWFHGTVEAGGRFFLNNPNRNGLNYQGDPSLASYYEYTDVRPGALANADISLGTSDGLYEIDAGGKNMGYNDQSYYLDFSKAGELYISGAYDETPHIYSTNAQTFYRGVGSTSLMLPSGYSPTANTPSATLPLQTAIGNLEGYDYGTEIGIRRDTASASVRWTPDSAWDIKANYSHMHRHGTQFDGVTGTTNVGGPGYPSGHGFPEGPIEVPRPVNDTTQNYGLNGEYAGASPWGQRLTVKLAYHGSNYDDALNGYTFEVPFTDAPSYPVAQMSTWPSNRSDAFGGTIGADLPWNSRYVGHVDYTMMRQNDTFIPMSTNAAYTLPQSSLDGKINTLLSDNVVTTQITPDLSSKLTYRYYNFDNETPELFFPNVISYDSTATSGESLNTLTMKYTKQNVGAALNWRPSRHWNVGAAYGWQRYDWTRADAANTTQNSGQMHADWMPTSWFTLRSSAYYGSRRHGNYDYYGYVCDFNFNGSCWADNAGYSQAYRQYFLDNRDRWKVNLGADLVVVPGLTVSPSFKYQDDNYGLDPKTEEGVRDSKSYSTGVDVTYLVNPDTSISVGYLYEFGGQLVYNCSCGGHTSAPVPGVVGNTALPINNPSSFMQTNDRITVNTFHALVRWAAIPNTLDLSMRYTLSAGTDHMQLLEIGSTTPDGFPDYRTLYQRLDAVLVYTFDKNMVRQLGWTGKIKAKLHYVWESNKVENWQIDGLAPYNPNFASGAGWMAMAWDNPNYSVNMLMASLAFQW